MGVVFSFLITTAAAPGDDGVGDAGGVEQSESPEEEEAYPEGDILQTRGFDGGPRRTAALVPKSHSTPRNKHATKEKETTSQTLPAGVARRLRGLYSRGNAERRWTRAAR